MIYLYRTSSNVRFLRNRESYETVWKRLRKSCLQPHIADGTRYFRRAWPLKPQMTALDAGSSQRTSVQCCHGALYQQEIDTQEYVENRTISNIGLIGLNIQERQKTTCSQNPLSLPSVVCFWKLCKCPLLRVKPPNTHVGIILAPTYISSCGDAMIFSVQESHTSKQRLC